MRPLVAFDQADRCVAEAHLECWLQHFEDVEFIESCRRRSAHFIPSFSQAPELTELLLHRLEQRQACSLVRVGDGDGNALAFAENPDDPLLAKCFDHIFRHYDSVLPSHDESHAFALRLRDACLGADILGIRSVETAMPLEDELCRRVLAGGDIRGAMGIMAARTAMRIAAVERRFLRKVVTSAWIYLGMLHELPLLMERAARILVVSGRGELAPEFRRRLGDKLLAFRQIPLEASRRKSTESHYYERFASELQFLEQDLSGVLVLVGGGFFGKIYCAHAKAHGAVAVDLGSGFDILAGCSTRPVHASIDIGRLSWINSGDDGCSSRGVAAGGRA